MARPRVERRSPRENQPAQHREGPFRFRCSCAGLATSQGWKTYACPKQSSSAPKKKARSRCSKKALQRSTEEKLAQAGISHQSWQQEASNRDSWRSTVRKASSEFEAERHEAAKEKRRRQKEQAASLSSSSKTFVCPKCSRV